MAQIADLVAERRAALRGYDLSEGRAALPEHDLPEGADSLWGLALSGGGIRSATFCFGLLRALAQNNLLLRVDVLSTVSGGGYIGSTLGRLFSRADSPREVKRINEAVKDANSRWFAWWLRANGRYLIPQGAKDRLYAIALYCRNLVGVHFEFGMVMIYLGVVLGLLDLEVWREVAQAGYSAPDRLFPLIRYLPHWLPVIALMEPIVAFVGAVFALAFWCVPWIMTPGRRGSRLMTIAGLWILAGCVAVGAWHYSLYPSAIRTTVGEGLRLILTVSGWLLLAAWMLAVPVALWTRSLSRSDMSTMVREDTARTWLTQALAHCFRVAAAIVLAGLIDRTAWFIAFELGLVAHVGLALGFAAAVVRALVPKLSGLKTGSLSIGLLLQSGRLAGYLLTFLLCSWWVSVVYAAGLGALFQHGGPHFSEAAAVLMAIALPVLTYLLVTGQNLAFLNLSSLHRFYRARLIRSYLGAANGIRLGRSKAIDAVDPVPSPMPPLPRLSVGDTQPYDDIRFSDYAPHARGGPVHLINMCINQTRDPRGGLFNQDRRGLALCVASGGYMRVAQQEWQALPPNDMTLGTWTAISGAAVAPGLGSSTRGGISALAVFAGMRLGYWWKARERKAWGAGRLCAKSFGLLSETFGAFRGTDTDNWFLTDGGHFENTGAYALLAEKAEIIVLADCGADPDYAFCDLENLVRKARIDLKAEIILQKPVDPGHDKPAPSIIDVFGKPLPNGQAQFAQIMTLFGSLNDLTSDKSTACLAMARVVYSEDPTKNAFLILIKPNISNGLPVDLINFKAQNPAFPQETTADQFFSEAQWESYSQLGYFLGAKLSKDFIAAVVAKPEDFFLPDQQVPFGARRLAAPPPEAPATAAAPAAAAAATRLPARINSAAVRAGLGVGAVATLAVSAWQAIDSTRTTDATRVSDERSALTELTNLWVKITPQSLAARNTDAAAVAAEVAAGDLAAAIVRTATTLCPAHGAGWFQTSPIAGSIYDTALQACDKIAIANRPSACKVLLGAANPNLQGTYPECLVRSEGIAPSLPAPRYWVYDYSDNALIANAHPCDTIAADRRREAQHEYATAASDPGLQAAAAQSTQRAEAHAGCANSDEVSGLATDTRLIGAAPQPPPTACRGKTIDLEVYGLEQLRLADAYRGQWQRLGAFVPPAENVNQTARLAGRALPLPMTTPTVRYHDGESAACARLLSRSVPGAHWTVEPLPPRLAATPGVIEVWLTAP